MGTRFLVTNLFLFAINIAFSQTNSYQLKMDSIFEISKEKVTTGVLIDRSPNIIEMKNFYLQDIVDSAIACKSLEWIALYYRIYASHLNLESFKYNLNIAEKYPNKLRPNDMIELGLIFYKYDKIKDNAVQNGLLTVDTINNKITDISSPRQSPLEINSCLAFSFLIPNSAQIYPV
ncbi:MAG: hypothetical protein LBV69_11015 [Bacteroidales bacterium]|jgi:hypothetical protein|nr:hypothetical protein [Bacteroidales bacterium]